MKWTLRIIGGLLVLGATVAFLPQACYRYTRWPRDVDYAAFVTFADAQAPLSHVYREIPKDLWPPAVQALKPRRVVVSDGERPSMDIVLHYGGAFPAAVGFRIIPPGDKPPNGRARDVILPTANARVFRIDLPDDQ